MGAVEMTYKGLEGKRMVTGLGSLCKMWGLTLETGFVGQEWGLGLMSPSPALIPPLPAMPAPAHS